MRFKVIKSTSEIHEPQVIYLRYIHYDDYGYCTTFTAYTYSTETTQIIEFGTVKIGCKHMNLKASQGTSQNGYSSYSIRDLIPTGYFSTLPEDFFSLGQNIQYYKTINEYFEDNGNSYYINIKDLAFDLDWFQSLYDNREPCLRNSLMRDIHYPNVEQFHRITMGDSELTKYRFSFNYYNNGINIYVDPTSLPPTNIHVLIGRNGVGKTWLLYHMVNRILESMELNLDEASSEKYKLDEHFTIEDSRNKFAGAIGMSFSVFDDGLSSIKIRNQPDDSSDKREKQKFTDDFKKKYRYIGLINKSQKDGQVKVKSVDNLAVEFKETLQKISTDQYKKHLYLEMCENLDTDTMFNDNGFANRLKLFFESDKKDYSDIINFFKKLSSGHMIIILSLTALCESIFEKTIVFIDEPETHLHPPLLSTYIRSLSFLLRKKNAVGIIATHSPIVVQEVPRSCVTKIERTKKTMDFYEPEIETFASSTDSLTREIFGYEVMKTGFYRLLEEELEKDFEDTYEKFDEQIGFLGQILIQGLINKQGSDNHEES